MKKSLLGLAFAFAMTNATAGIVPAPNYFTIDDFDTTQMSVGVPGVGSASDSQAAAVFGGTRTIDTVGNGVLATSADVIVPPGIMAFSTAAITTGMTTLSYSSTVGIDLEQGKINNFFGLDVLSIDQGGIGLDVTVNGVTVALGADLVVNFSEFAGVDFTSVTDISLKINATGAASDATFDAFNVSGDMNMPMPPTTIPVPASLPLLGMGLIAFGFGRRKVK